MSSHWDDAKLCDVRLVDLVERRVPRGRVVAAVSLPLSTERTGLRNAAAARSNSARAPKRIREPMMASPYLTGLAAACCS
jgi:hypothetical protein